MFSGAARIVTMMTIVTIAWNGWDRCGVDGVGSSSELGQPGTLRHPVTYNGAAGAIPTWPSRRRRSHWPWPS